MVDPTGHLSSVIRIHLRSFAFALAAAGPSVWALRHYELIDGSREWLIGAYISSFGFFLFCGVTVRELIIAKKHRDWRKKDEADSKSWRSKSNRI